VLFNLDNLSGTLVRRCDVEKATARSRDQENEPIFSFIIEWVACFMKDAPDASSCYKSLMVVLFCFHDGWKA
jgi:hypothetical protein